MTKPSSMTVAVLRKELKKRNLDTEGLKAVLVERLQKALDAEATGDETTAAAPAEPEVRDARGRASFFARSPERSPSRASPLGRSRRARPRSALQNRRDARRTTRPHSSRRLRDRRIARIPISGRADLTRPSPHSRSHSRSSSRRPPPWKRPRNLRPRPKSPGPAPPRAETAPTTPSARLKRRPRRPPSPRRAGPRRRHGQGARHRGQGRGGARREPGGFGGAQSRARLFRGRRGERALAPRSRSRERGPANSPRAGAPGAPVVVEGTGGHEGASSVAAAR